MKLHVTCLNVILNILPSCGHICISGFRCRLSVTTSTCYNYDLKRIQFKTNVIQIKCTNMYNYAATIPGEYTGILCVYVCARGLRVCVRVCTYASIPMYMCTCVRAHVRMRDRTRVRTQLRLCEGSHVCVCVRACVRARARV